MKFPIKLVYVCGPITAPTKDDRDANILRGRQAGLEVWKSGAMAIVPHLNSLSMYDSGVECSDIYLGDLELLKRCDAMLLLDGWTASQGCNYEVAWAKHNSIPVFGSLDGLRAWLYQEKVAG